MHADRVPGDLANALGIAMGVACLWAPAHADSPQDAFLGAWNLQRESSVYAAQEVPQSMRIAIEAAPRGLHYQSSTQQSGGRVSACEFTAGLDGTATLVVGSSGFLAPVALRRVDELNIDATYTSGPKKIAWSRWALSADGKELRITTTYLTQAGDTKVNVARFKKVDSSNSDTGTT